MSYLGAIRFVLTTDGSSVSDVSIEPAKELRIEKLLCGKRVEDALALLPPLFALCPDSQTAAAAVACDVAQNSVPSQEVLVKARFANHWNSLTRACVSLRSSVPAKITEPPKLKA